MPSSTSDQSVPVIGHASDRLLFGLTSGQAIYLAFKLGEMPCTSWLSSSGRDALRTIRVSWVQLGLPWDTWADFERAILGDDHPLSLSVAMVRLRAVRALAGDQCGSAIGRPGNAFPAGAATETPGPSISKFPSIDEWLRPTYERAERIAAGEMDWVSREVRRSLGHMGKRGLCEEIARLLAHRYADGLYRHRHGDNGRAWAVSNRWARLYWERFSGAARALSEATGEAHA